MVMSQEEDSLKAQGNDCFAKGNFAESIDFFTQAIALNENNHVLYSNRSAAYASLKQYEKAVEDANKAIEINSSWSKAYGRKGAALFGQGLYEQAKEAYEQGLAIDPSNMTLKKGLADVEQQSMSSADGSRQNPFSDPGMWAKLASNPKLAAYMSQPDFVQKLADLQRDPNNLQQHMSDPRIMEVLGALLGINISGASADHEESTSVPAQKSKPEPEVTPMEDVKQELTEAEMMKLASNEEKELGNAAYKSKNFEKALDHYGKAFSLDETNIAVLNNKAAVYFEMADYDNCIKICEESVEKGRDLRCDYKIVAKAFGRMGSAYDKKNDFENALKFYNKSLTEHRTPDILAKLKDVEKRKIQKEKEDYCNPEIAEQERNLGNELFKKGDFVEAVKHYTEATKRDPQDPRAYSNRAACYTKLAAFPEALKDCEMCIANDEKFIKGYIRKASVQVILKEYMKCIETCELASKHDQDGKNKAEIDGIVQKAYMAMYAQNNGQSNEDNMKRAMEDPEIQRIANDPVMRTILEQMQSDPKAVAEHMKNPMIASKIRKLVAAGIIKMG